MKIYAPFLLGSLLLVGNGCTKAPPPEPELLKTGMGHPGGHNILIMLCLDAYDEAPNSTECREAPQPLRLRRGVLRRFDSRRLLPTVGRPRRHDCQNRSRLPPNIGAQSGHERTFKKGAIILSPVPTVPWLRTHANKAKQLQSGTTGSASLQTRKAPLSRQRPCVWPP